LAKACPEPPCAIALVVAVLLLVDAVPLIGAAAVD
jgi:hypothetical protein